MCEVLERGIYEIPERQEWLSGSYSNQFSDLKFSNLIFDYICEYVTIDWKLEFCRAFYDITVEPVECLEILRLWDGDVDLFWI